MLYEKIDGWTCVALVSSDNRLHLNSNKVEGVKLSDDEINELRSDSIYYNIKAVATDFLKPKNDWIDYPHTLYLTNKYVFSSIELSTKIKYSNLISLSEDSDAMDILQKEGSIGFGCGNCGDTFFAYGAVDENVNGLNQSFSGAGSGSIWIK